MHLKDQLHSPEFFVGDPYPTYRALRASDPVCWNDVTKFWALLKYEDIRYVSSNPGKFSSANGITLPDPAIPSPAIEGNLIFTDPPRHRQLRKLISAGFTKRQVGLLAVKIRDLVLGILDEVDPGQTLEFAEGVAAPLPTRLIAEILGAPPSDWERFRVWSDACVGHDDPEIELDAFVAIGELFEYFQQLIAARRVDEFDDVLSVLAHAEVDGQRLADDELLQFAFLLLVAGNETTRNLIALGTLALISHPEQCSQLVDDPSLIPGAVEEMLRWTSPVTHMARIATEDVELRGRLIKKGESVVMFYGSANRDERRWDAPEVFDITRNSAGQLGFGAGVHACVGMGLARLEMTAVLGALLTRVERFELTGPVVRKPNNLIRSFAELPVTVHPARSGGPTQE